jgi:hypothetical protein
VWRFRASTRLLLCARSYGACWLRWFQTIVCPLTCLLLLRQGAGMAATWQHALQVTPTPCLPPYANVARECLTALLAGCKQSQQRCYSCSLRPAVMKNAAWLWALATCTAKEGTSLTPSFQQRRSMQWHPGLPHPFPALTPDAPAVCCTSVSATSKGSSTSKCEHSNQSCSRQASKQAMLEVAQQHRCGGRSPVTPGQRVSAWRLLFRYDTQKQCPVDSLRPDKKSSVLVLVPLPAQSSLIVTCDVAIRFPPGWLQTRWCSYLGSSVSAAGSWHQRSSRGPTSQVAPATRCRCRSQP